MNDRVMLFAGTAEGRELYEYLKARGIPADVYTATGYGRELLEHREAAEGPGRESPGGFPEQPGLHAGRLTEAGIGEELRRCLGLLPEQEGTLWVIDATHPYAAEATANISRACERAQGRLRLLRLVRPRAAWEAAGSVAVEAAAARAVAVGSVAVEAAAARAVAAGSAAVEVAAAGSAAAGPETVWVQDASEAAVYVDGRQGNVFVATGSKELAAFTAVRDYRSRIYVRLLPLPEMVGQAVKLGFTGRHLYCMQGPFSAEMNELLLRETGSRYLVTKEAGREGGFPQKLEAAARVGAVCVIIRRPSAESGLTLEKIIQLLEEAFR